MKRHEVTYPHSHLWTETFSTLQLYETHIYRQQEIDFSETSGERLEQGKIVKHKKLEEKREDARL
ncbi:hypothetical protein EXN66_Car006312 [Channa argus]|uniref:Uncharacterized protein n=1 Tax=Channa argus TaxID=215402 RepID=A0A6G1PK91_CHAAH|nr:hypothetical protein EXN66_Car006312 [Channa argus]